MVLAALFGSAQSYSNGMSEYLQELWRLPTNDPTVMDTQLTATVKVGGSNVKVVLDTGSAMTWIADTHCKTCT